MVSHNHHSFRSTTQSNSNGINDRNTDRHIERNIDRNLDRSLDRILYNSSANLASLISLARLHEETISRLLRNQSSNQTQMINLITGIIETTNQHEQDEQEPEFVPYSINNTEIFNECKFNTIAIPLNTSCPISFDIFNGDDDVILIKKCNHIFKKQSLESWLERSHRCPYCRSLIGE
jgi:hypothetical protein